MPKESQLSNLEKEGLKYFLKSNNIDETYFGKDFQLLKITSREITKTGFITDLTTNKSLKKHGIKSSRWAKVGVLLNNSVRVRLLFYVDNYMFNGIEGFTYGDTLWPELIESFEIRELDDNEF
jgi:hypothetical protein